MKILETERREIAKTFRDCVERSGMSQAKFAAMLGTSASRISTYLSGETMPSAALYLRAIRTARATDAARCAGLMTADMAADAVSAGLNRGDQTWAMKMVIQGRDHLRALISETREALPTWETRTRQISDPAFEVLMAALTAHEFETAGMSAPEWTRTAPLAQSWTPENPFLDEDQIVASTPNWLAERNIFIAENDLVTA